MVFGTILFGVGRRFYSILKAEKELKSVYPDEPWLWKEDWARSEARPNLGGKAAFFGGMGVVFLALSLPLVFKLMREWERHGHPAFVFFLIFPALGLFFLWSAFLWRLRNQKYGKSYLGFQQVPMRLGSDLSGLLHIGPHPISGGSTLELKLSNLREVTSGSGKNRSTSTSILWQTVEKVFIEDAGQGAELPIRIGIPWEGEPADYSDPNRRTLWKLEVRSAQKGADFALEFEIPVFLKAEEGSEGRELDPFGGVRDRSAQPEPEQIRGFQVSTTPEGWLSAYFPPFRSASVGLIPIVLGMVFAGAGVFFGLNMLKTLPVFFVAFAGIVPLIFLVIGAALILIGIWALFSSQRLTLAPEELRVATRFLFLSTSRVVRADQVKELKIHQQASSGTRVWYAIRVFTADGSKFNAGNMISDRMEAQWLLAKLKEGLGQ